jgi:hypothetical protein
MRDELLDGELFDTLWEAKVLCGARVKMYNTVRPIFYISESATPNQVFFLFLVFLLQIQMWHSSHR